MTIGINQCVKILRSIPWSDAAHGRVRSINIGSLKLWCPPVSQALGIYDVGLDLEDLETTYAVLDVLDYLDEDGQPTGDLELIEFQESINCDECHVEGYRGDHPHVGDLVVMDTGDVVCDACADDITRSRES